MATYPSVRLHVGQHGRLRGLRAAVRRLPAVPVVGRGDAVTSVYVPVFVGGVPETLGRPGTARPTSFNPEHAPQDEPAEGSYWWTFQRLLDAVKGDALGSAFAERQPQVRDAFDRLETEWRAELARRPGELGAFTGRCVEQAVDAAEGLIERFSG